FTMTFGIQAIPRLSQAGMPSRSEGWGGLFKDEQYRLNQTAGGETWPGGVWMILTGGINRYCSSLKRPPRLRCAKAPRLTQAGNGSINFVTSTRTHRHRNYEHQH